MKSEKVKGRPVKSSSVKLKRDVSRLYRDGFNASQIAKLKGFSRQYISRLLVDLKDVNPSLVNSFLSSRPDDVGVGRKNLHAQQLRVTVHDKSSKYLKNPQVYFKNFVDGVDVACQGDYIIIRSNQKRFYAESEVKALWKSLDFWNGVISKLEDRLGVLIFKKGCEAFRFLYGEFETGDSVVAVDCEKRGIIWRVFHSDDGKLRLDVDWSEGVPNHETHHKKDNFVDSITFNNHVNSILDNPHAPTFAELVKVVQEVAVVNKETALGLKAVVSVLKSQFPERADPVDVFAGGVPDYFG